MQSPRPEDDHGDSRPADDLDLLVRLAGLLEARGAREAAARCHERLAEAGAGSSVEELARAADLYDAAHSPARAAVCRALLARRVAFPAARDAVPGLIAARMYKSVVALLERGDLAKSERADELARLGASLVEEPIEHSLARACLERAERLAPGHAVAQEGLRQLADFGRDWARAGRTFRSRAIEERDRRAAAAIYLRLAALHALHDPSGDANVEENLRRCFLLWPAIPWAAEVVERIAAHRAGSGGGAGRLGALAATALDRSVASEIWERGAVRAFVEPEARSRAVSALRKAFDLSPGRTPPAVLLAELAIEEGDGAAAAEILERHLASCPRASPRLRLFAAGILLALPDGRARACAQAEALLGDPATAGSRALLDICEKLGDPDLLGRAKLSFLGSGGGRREERLDETGGPGAGRPADQEGAMEAENSSGPAELRQAFIAAGQTLREHPEEKAALDAALAAAERAGAAQELAGLLGELVPRVQGPPAAARMHWAMARLYEGPLADAARAAEEWRHVLQFAPDDRDASEALAALLARSGGPGSSLEALRRQLAVTEDVEGRVGLLREIGRIQEEGLRDAAGAINTYRRLLELSPEEPEALARLDRLLAGAERWSELAPVLEREVRLGAAAKDGKAQAAALSRLGQLREGPLADPAAALDLYRAALQAQPNHAETVARLEALMKRLKTPGAAEILEEVYRSAQDWPRYAETLEIHASAVADPRIRKDLLVQLARVRERQQRPDLAFMALCRVFPDDPLDAALRAELARVADLAETREELAGLYEEALGQSGSPAVIAALSLELGRLAEQRSDPAGALANFERAHELDPDGAAAALPALERLYRQSERWDALAATLEEMAARATKSAEAAAVLFRLGQLYEEHLAAPDRAARAYEALLAQEPNHLPALRALDRLYESAGRGPELFAVLERQRAAAPAGQSRDRIVAHMAEVASSLLHDDERAAKLWQEVLLHDPKAESAMAGLEQVLERLGRWPDLAALLQARLQATVDPREITRLNDRIGWVMGVKLGQADEAAKRFQAILERDPKNRRALEALRDIHAARGDLEGLAGVLRRLIPLQESAAQVKEIRLQLAETLDRLGRPQEALEAARRAMDLEPHGLQELDRVEALFRAHSAWPETVRVMEARADVLASERPADAAEIRFAAAQAYAATLGQPERAVAVLEKILELDPTSERALAALEETLAGGGQWQRLAALLDRLSHQVAGRERQLALLRRLAEVQEQRLGQKDLAFLALCRGFELDPRDAELAGLLRRLARETGAVEELLSVYESVMESVGAAPGAEALFLQLADIQDEDLDDAAAAEATLRRWLEARPASPLVVDRLAQLFARRGRTREHLLTLEQKVNVVLTPAERTEALRALARASDAAGEVAEAVDALQRAREGDPENADLIRELAGVYRREKAWADLVALLQETRDRIPAGPERVVVQIEIAEITETGLGDDEAAVAAYQMALELDPGSGPALRALERLYGKLERPVDLLRVLERRAATATPAEKVEVLLAAARTWDQKLGKAPEAIACLEAVVELDAGSVPALEGLEDLYRRTGEADRLALTLQRRLPLARDVAEAVAIQVSLADVWRRGLRRIDHAEGLLVRALEMDPGRKDALHALGEIHEETGNWPAALEAIGREMRLETDPAAVVELHRRSAQIHLAHLGDPTGAAAEFQRCLEIDPAHVPSLRGLQQIYRAAEDHDAYARMALREAEAVSDPAEKTRLFHALGVFQQEVLQDLVAAESCFVEALAATPGHVPSAQPLAAIYQSREEWEQAEKMLDIVVAGTTGDPSEGCRHSYRLGYVADKLGKMDKALSCYRNACSLDGSYLPALEGLGHLLVKSGGRTEALAVYQKILSHHRDELTDLEVVEILWQLGMLRRQLGDAAQAEKDFQRALQLDPAHEPSLQALVEILEGAERWEEALEQRNRLVDLLEGPPRFEVCIGIARLAYARLGDPYQAIDANLTALKIVPDAVEVLEDLVSLYLETRQTQKAVETLEQLLALPAVRGDPKLLGRHHHQLAQIYRDELGDDGRAAEHFNLALDADPTFVEAFAALEKLLTERRSWNALEQGYHAMIRRLPKTPETLKARVALWRNLGELYRKALKSLDGAITAYEVVHKADPADAQAGEILAELYASKPGMEAKAIEMARQVLTMTGKPAAAGALARLHAARRSYDQAFVAAQVAVHLLGDPDPDQKAVIERLKPYAREMAARPLTERLWIEHVYHERLRGPLAEVLALCQQATGGVFAVDHARLNVNPRRDRVDLAQSMLFFVNTYKYVAKTLGMEAVDLFKSPGLSGLQLGNTWPPCLLAGEDLFKDRPKRDLWFLVGKAMAFRRPELALARLHPPEEIDAIFQAALFIAAPSFRPTANPEELQRQGRRLERGLSDSARPALLRAARECLKDPVQMDLRGYLEAVEQTATRVGVLLASDLEAVRRSLTMDPGAVARLPERRRLRDLVLYCTSESYALLRGSIGISVDVPAAGRSAG